MDIRDFSMDLFSLAGKRAVVTGGNSGLGQAFSLALAKAGADVFVPSVVDDDGTTRALVEAEGRRYAFLQVDLTAADAPARIVAECDRALGGIDVLVNSAGICLLDDVEAFDRAKWDPMVAVNLTAPFALGHAVAERFIAQRSGKIINIASLFAFLGGQWSPAYAATKHGIVGFTKAYCTTCRSTRSPPGTSPRRSPSRPGRTRRRTDACSTTSRPGAGETSPTSWARPSSSPRVRPTT
jgi:NAD(P)-dependent dehydrogenase (short-subunit alcohol dehydrogenase family)